jgi:hypothetical protein
MPFPPCSSTPLGLASIWDTPDCRGIPCRLPKPRQAYCRQECARPFPHGLETRFCIESGVPGMAIAETSSRPGRDQPRRSRPRTPPRIGGRQAGATEGAKFVKPHRWRSLYSCLIPVARCKPRSRSAERVWRSLQIWPHGMRRICQSSLGECVSHQDVAVFVISLGAGTPKSGRSSKRTPTVKKTLQSMNSRFRFASWDPKSSIARNRKLPILDFHNATIKSQQPRLVECRNGNNVPVTRTHKVLE